MLIQVTITNCFNKFKLYTLRYAELERHAINITEVLFLGDAPKKPIQVFFVLFRRTCWCSASIKATKDKPRHSPHLVGFVLRIRLMKNVCRQQHRVLCWGPDRGLLGELYNQE